MTEPDRSNELLGISLSLDEIDSEFEILNNSIQEALRQGDYQQARKLIDKAERIKAFRAKVEALGQEWLTLSRNLNLPPVAAPVPESTPTPSVSSVPITIPTPEPVLASTTIPLPSKPVANGHIAPKSSPEPPQSEIARRFSETLNRNETQQQSAPVYTRTSSSRGSSGSQRTPEEMFFIPILRALIKFGGRAEVSQVIAALEKEMKAVLTKHDYERLTSENQEIRWHASAKWARNELLKQGLIESSRIRGLWEISQKGRQYFERHNQKIN